MSGNKTEKSFDNCCDEWMQKKKKEREKKIQSVNNGPAVFIVFPQAEHKRADSMFAGIVKKMDHFEFTERFSLYF